MAKEPGWSPYAETYDPLKAGSIDGTDTTPHDRALVRALSSKFRPPGKKTTCTDPEKTVFVSRLNYRTSQDKIQKEFSHFGKVTSCTLVRDIVTGASKGYAFIEFEQKTDADRAWRNAMNMILDDRVLLVEREYGRTMQGWIPRRLGGGIGGKKESGQLRYGGRDRPFRKPIILKNANIQSPVPVEELPRTPYLNKSFDIDNRSRSERHFNKNYSRSNYSPYVDRKYDKHLDRKPRYDYSSPKEDRVSYKEKKYFNQSSHSNRFSEYQQRAHSNESSKYHQDPYDRKYRDGYKKEENKKNTHNSESLFKQKKRKLDEDEHSAPQASFHREQSEKKRHHSKNKHKKKSRHASKERSSDSESSHDGKKKRKHKKKKRKRSKSDSSD